MNQVHSKRRGFEVSEEVAVMWDEIVCYEKSKSNNKKRYYPAHTMEKLIKSRYELLKVFGE
ncbi:hypothetical protein CUM64_12825 [Enterococcus faecalis]|nr:hypothetical protein CUM64_12825 [Enterococcus faecalis]